MGMGFTRPPGGVGSERGASGRGRGQGVTDGDDERCQTVSAFVELMADLDDIQDSAPLSWPTPMTKNPAVTTSKTAPRVDAGGNVVAARRVGIATATGPPTGTSQPGQQRRTTTTAAAAAPAR